MFAAIFFYGKVLATTAAGIVFFFTVQDLMTIVNLWINIMIIFFFLLRTNGNQSWSNMTNTFVG